MNLTGYEFLAVCAIILLLLIGLALPLQVLMTLWCVCIVLIGCVLAAIVLRHMRERAARRR